MTEWNVSDRKNAENVMAQHGILWGFVVLLLLLCGPVTVECMNFNLQGEGSSAMEQLFQELGNVYRDYADTVNTPVHSTAVFSEERKLQWMNDYQNTPAFVDGRNLTSHSFTLQYSAIGSDAARRDLLKSSGELFEWKNAALFYNSDVKISQNEFSEFPESHIRNHIRLDIGYNYLVFVKNVPAVPGHIALYLTRAILQGIYCGEIEYWDDSEIVQINTQLNGLYQLPHEKIILILRSDKSGTNGVLTEALVSFGAQCMKQQPFTDGAYWEEIFNSSRIVSASSEQDAIAKLQNHPHSLAYVSMSGAKSAGIMPMPIYNLHGDLVDPATIPVNTDMAKGFYNVHALDEFGTIDSSIPNTYPIPMSMYTYMHKNIADRCEDMGAVLLFFNWMLTDDSRVPSVFTQLGLVRASYSMRALNLNWIQNVTCNNGFVIPQAMPPLRIGVVLQKTEAQLRTLNCGTPTYEMLQVSPQMGIVARGARFACMSTLNEAGRFQVYDYMTRAYSKMLPQNLHIAVAREVTSNSPVIVLSPYLTSNHHIVLFQDPEPNRVRRLGFAVSDPVEVGQELRIYYQAYYRVMKVLPQGCCSRIPVGSNDLCLLTIVENQSPEPYPGQAMFDRTGFIGFLDNILMSSSQCDVADAVVYHVTKVEENFVRTVSELDPTINIRMITINSASPVSISFISLFVVLLVSILFTI